jgi:hypothetical protein
MVLWDCLHFRKPVLGALSKEACLFTDVGIVEIRKETETCLRTVALKKSDGPIKLLGLLPRCYGAISFRGPS